MTNLSPLSFSPSLNSIPNKIKTNFSPEKKDLYFGMASDHEGETKLSDSSEKKAFSFSAWKGQMRENHPWVRSVLDTVNWNYGSSASDKYLGEKFAFGSDDYPKNLAMADFYFERALKGESYQVQDITAKDFGELILKRFGEEKGAADIGFKYLDKGVQSAGRVVNLTIYTLLEYGHLILEDGSTLKDKAKALILDHGDGVEPNELESFQLLEEHFPEEVNLRQSVLEKKAKSSEEPWVFKNLGDAYYTGIKGGLKSNSKKALENYELYLKHLEEFDKNETPRILHRLAALYSLKSDPVEKSLQTKIGFYHRIAEPFLEQSHEFQIPKAFHLNSYDQVKVAELMHVINELPKGTPMPIRLMEWGSSV